MVDLNIFNKKGAKINDEQTAVKKIQIDFEIYQDNKYQNTIKFWQDFDGKTLSNKKKQP